MNTQLEIPMIDPTLSAAQQMDSAGAIVTGFIFFLALLAVFAIGKIGQFALAKILGKPSVNLAHKDGCPCCKRIRD